MYDQTVIERRVAEYERSSGRKLREVPIDRVTEVKHYLEGRLNAKGVPVRPPLTPELAAFITNERAMCKASFLYWAERYALIEYRVGHGGVGLFKALESQYVLLKKMAIAEREMWDRKDLGDEKFLGLCFIIHKARQLGFTTLCQLLLLHYSLFYSDYKTLSASVDDQKTQDMHAKWMLAYSGLPWWMKVSFTSEEKDRGKWLANGSYCALQDFAQKGGLGQGMTWSGLHLTELAAVADDYCREQVQNHLLPSLADTLRVIAFMESTAQGAGNWWNQIWDKVDAGRFGRWRAAFVPAYAEPNRWSRPNVPVAWVPAEETVKYAENIVRTSPKYMNGVTVTPTRNHLYWWEEERQVAIDTGTLNLFSANHCTTPDESFVYSEGGAFNSMIITSLSNRVDKPAVAYEMVSTPQQRQAVRERMNIGPGAPPIMSGAGGVDLVPVHTTERDEKDPRGLVLMFERPRIDVVYSLGADPVVGIPGWTRQFRSDEISELKRDNACLSGWYKDPKSQLITQAFELAGPLSPVEFARCCNVLGRVFSGANGPDRGSSIIIEVNNGGTEVQNLLMNPYRYYSLWQRTSFNGAEQKQLEQWGWVSTMRSVQELWVHMKDTVEQPFLQFRPRSSFLLKEMQLARWDPVKRRGAVPEGNGQHDDRIVAAMLALWQLRGFVPFGSYGEAAKLTAARQKRSSIDFQEMDIASVGEYNDAIDVWYNRVLYGS